MTMPLSDEAVAPSPLQRLADVVVLRARPLRHGIDPLSLSRFADWTWSLAEAQPDQHAQPIMLYWSTFPSALVDDIKVFTLAVLDCPYPRP
ncbi:hypothetical protein ACWEFD_35575 [Streptomyces ardesiacus]